MSETLRNQKGEASTMEQSPMYFSERPMYLKCKLKNKKTQWEESNRDKHQGKYGRRRCLNNQTRVGMRWQAQDQIMQTIQATCRPVIKNAQVYVL